MAKKKAILEGEVSADDVAEAVAEDMTHEAAEEAIEEAVEEIATSEPIVEALDAGNLILCITLKKLHMHGTIYMPQSDIALTPGQMEELVDRGAVVQAPPV